MNTDFLKELGFEKASKSIEEKQLKMLKLHEAYNHYEFVTQENIKKFNEELYHKTQKEDKYSTSYDKLVEIPVKDYPEAPPEQALTKLKEAIGKGCFDEFVVAKIESIKEVKDPILFGKINGCGDRFFIAQWDNDVTIEMIKAIE